MADVVTGRFLYFDSTNEVITQLVRVQGIFWTSSEESSRDIAADDDFLLLDAEGISVIGKRAEAVGDGLEVWFGLEGLPIKGLDVDVLDGGVVYIILKDDIKV